MQCDVVIKTTKVDGVYDKDPTASYLEGCTAPTSMKEFNKQLNSYAKTKIKKEEVIYSIAEKEKINVSKNEYEFYITKTLKQYGYTPESFKETNGKRLLLIMVKSLLAQLTLRSILISPPPLSLLWGLSSHMSFAMS